MEVKGIVGTVDADGIVQLSCNGDIVTKQDVTLRALYGTGEESTPPSQCTDVVPSSDAASSESTEMSWSEPWRGKVDAAARDTIAEIEDRGDINMDDCPIYEDLKNLRKRLRTEKSVDQDRACELIEGGRMFLFLCEWDDS